MSLLSSARAESATSPSANSAAGPSAKGDVAAARAAADEGYAAFQAQDYERALALFQRANAIIDAPTHSLYIARTQVNLGRLQAAADTYRRIAEAALPKAASAAFHRAREEAQIELSALQPRLARLPIATDAPAGASVQVTRDGQTAPAAALGEPTPVAGGVVSSRVSQSVSQPVSQSEGTTDDGRSARIAGWVTVGVGAASVVAGVPLLLVGLNRRSVADDVSETCLPACSAAEGRWIRDTYGQANTLVVSGLVSMAFGALSGVVGETLLRSSANRDQSGRIHVEPWITVDAVGLSGRF